MARIRRAHTQELSQPTAWKVGKYIRLSRDDGDVESESIANQRKILDEQIPGYFDGDYTVVDEYIDDGRTGTSDDTRPDFLRLVDDVKKGKINCIITKNLSRAFRNSANQGKFLEEFIPLYHTRFISLYEPHMDTFLNPEIVHSLEVSITGFLNEQYAYKTSVDVRRTFETKRKKGEFIGAFAPYGLKKRPEDKNRLMIDEEAAQVVRDIFHWFVAEGMSKRGIAQRLNTLGIPNPTAYKRQKGLSYYNPQLPKNDGLWSEKTVGSILCNEMYIGNMVQGRQRVVSYKVHNRVLTEEKDWYIVENTHEGIVDNETFAKARDLRQRDTRASPGQTAVCLFSGFLRCADCQKAMTRKRAKNLVYYNCSTYCRKSKTACTKHTIREDRLEQAVLLAIQREIALASGPEELGKKLRRAPGVPPEVKGRDRLLEEKQKELEALAAVTDTLYLDWRTGTIPEAAYYRRKARVEARTEQLQRTIAHLKEEQDARDAAGASYVEEFLQYGTVRSLERGLLVALVDTIWVHEGGRLTIRFRFAGPHRQAPETESGSNLQEAAGETRLASGAQSAPNGA